MPAGIALFSKLLKNHKFLQSALAGPALLMALALPGAASAQAIAPPPQAKAAGRAGSVRGRAIGAGPSHARPHIDLATAGPR